MIWEFFYKFIFSKRAGALVRRIAWLSIVSIFISVTAFLVVLFVMNGMNEGIENRILALEPHLTLQVPGIRDGKTLEVHPAYVKLTQRNDVDLSLYESQDVVLRTAEGQFKGAVAQGISQDTMQRMQRRVDELNSLKKNKTASLERWGPNEVPGDGEVAIGTDLARALRVNEGEYLTVIPPESLLLPPGEAPRFEKVRIRKIISTNLADIDSKFIFYQSGKAMGRLSQSTSRQVGVEVWAKDYELAEEIKDQVMKFEGVQVETWIDRNSDLFLALKLEKLMIGIFLGLAGMVSGGSIVGVLSLLLYQKSREIGLLKTLGLSSKKIINIFTKIGLVLTFIGLFSGALLGTAVSYYIEKNPLDVLSDAYYDSRIPALVDARYVIVVLLIGLTIGFLGSWLPTKKITKEAH